jgi:hypothetical protein
VAETYPKGFIGELSWEALMPATDTANFILGSCPSVAGYLNWEGCCIELDVPLVLVVVGENG